MSIPSAHVWLLEGVEYHIFKTEDCWYLSDTSEGQRHGRLVALDAAAVFELMSLSDDVKEQTQRAKRLLGEGDYAPMTQLQCPVCGSASKGGYHTDDDTVFNCPKCGDYRLTGTAITLFEKGTLKKPSPESFRDLVKRKRGSSAEYPVITQYDLGG